MCGLCMLCTVRLFPTLRIEYTQVWTNFHRDYWLDFLFLSRIIRIGPITKPNKPYSDRFRADKYNHYLSMISKISPSPDWFVGIDRLDLCNASDCRWKDNITVQLRPMDAGMLLSSFC